MADLVLGRQIGKGTFGDVFVLNRHMVVKRIALTDTTSNENTRGEIKVMKKLIE